MGFNINVPGHCPHSAVIFITWHRPYVALHQQLIWHHTQRIVTKYPDDQREEYQAAALTLRQPYWDWALHPSLPDVTTAPVIGVQTPNGHTQFTNALYSYHFQGKVATENGFEGDDDLSNFTSTVRCWDQITQSSNLTLANSNLQAQASHLVTDLYTLFTTTPSYSDFSTMYCSDGRNSGNNIEQIHGIIHSSVGYSPTDGHMANIPLAAFDPVFMLHHSNIDRLFALWQVFNSIEYVVPTKNEWGTYFEPAGYTETATSH
jgi:tyrosinase